MLIPDIPKKPSPPFRRKHSHAEGMDRRIAKPLIVEPALPIQKLEILLISLSSKEVQVSDLEIAEELAVVVDGARGGVEEPRDVGFRVDEVRVRGDEVLGLRPQGGEGARVVEDGHVEAVNEVVVAEEGEGVVGDGAEEMNLSFIKSVSCCDWRFSLHAKVDQAYLWLDSPVEIEFEQPGVFIEEATVPATHVSIAQHPSLAYANRAQVVQAVHVSIRIDPLGR